MKRNLLAISLAAAALACLAGLDYSDIVKWGLVRRSDLAAARPADGYRIVVVTNYTPSFAWTLDGYFNFDAGDETYPTAISVSNLVIPGLPKTLAMNGMSAMVPVPGYGYIVGAFDNGGGLSGVGVLNGDNQFDAAGFYSTQSVDGSGFTFSQGVANYYWGAMTLTRTDYPDIVTMTTNYFAFGTGLVWRDMYDPCKFARLENGVVCRYHIVRIPGVWNFSGYDVSFLTQPLGMIADPDHLEVFEPLANLRWQVRFDGAYRYYVFNEDEVTLLWISEPFLTNPAQTTLLFNGQGEIGNQTLMYIPAHSQTNSL